MTVFFALLGSALVKAAHKMLTKLTPAGGFLRIHFGSNDKIIFDSYKRWSLLYKETKLTSDSVLYDSSKRMSLFESKSNHKYVGIPLFKMMSRSCSCFDVKSFKTVLRRSKKSFLSMFFALIRSKRQSDFKILSLIK